MIDVNTHNVKQLKICKQHIEDKNASFWSVSIVSIGDNPVNRDRFTFYFDEHEPKFLFKEKELIIKDRGA